MSGLSLGPHIRWAPSPPNSRRIAGTCRCCSRSLKRCQPAGAPQKIISRVPNFVFQTKIQFIITLCALKINIDRRELYTKKTATHIKENVIALHIPETLPNKQETKFDEASACWYLGDKPPILPVQGGADGCRQRIPARRPPMSSSL